MKPLVQELEVAADYGQIYIYDPQTQLPDEDTSEDDDPLQRAMDDAYESRRFVGYSSGLVDVVTPSQYNWKAPMRIEVSDTSPASDLEAWDHVVEVSLPVPSGTLVFQSSGGGRADRDGDTAGQLPRTVLGARLRGRRRGDRGPRELPAAAVARRGG